MAAFNGYQNMPLPATQEEVNANTAITKDRFNAGFGGTGKGVSDIATLPLRLGSWGLASAGVISPQDFLANENVAVSAGNFIPKSIGAEENMRNYPVEAAIGEALSPMPFAVASAPKRMYGAMFNPVSKSSIAHKSTRGNDAVQITQANPNAKQPTLYQKNPLPASRYAAREEEARKATRLLNMKSAQDMARLKASQKIKNKTLGNNVDSKYGTAPYREYNHEWLEGDIPF